MKFIIICLLILLVNGEGQVYYRYKNGTITRGGKQYTAVDGSLWISEGQLIYLGMHKPSMTPFLSGGMIIGEIGKEQETYTCALVIWERDWYREASGTITIEGDVNKLEVTGSCKIKGESVSFNSTNIKTMEIFFPPAEAGLRAKDLIGQTNERYAAHEVIFYSIVDVPYVVAPNCRQGFYNYPDAPEPGPGIIVLGKDTNHCAILDNEGTKFIHSNPVKKKVTEDSIAMLQTYFPKGVYYKRYPRNLLLQV